MNTRRRLAAFILAFIALAASALPLSADVLFTRQTTYSDPVSLGIIVGDQAPYSPLQSNLGGNQGNRIFPFLDASGNLRIALTFYGGVGQGSADTIRIYDPGAKANWAVPSNWDTAVASVSSTTQNTRALTTIGPYMYTTGYDKAIISRVVMTGDSYTENATWTHPDINGKHGEGLFAYNGYLYAIITDTTGDPMQPEVAYGRNQLWKFDRNLNVIPIGTDGKDYVEMIGRNMDGQNGGIYVRNGSKLYVCSFGGYQETGGGYNGATTIEVCDLETFECTQLALGSEMQEKTNGEWQYMFSGLAFVNDKVYIHGTTWTVVNGLEGNHEMVVYETTEEKLLEGDIGTRIGLFNGNYGVQMGFTYDSDTGYLWAREGDSIQRLNADGTWTKFSSTDLYGSLTDMAMIGVASTGNESAVLEPTISIDPNGVTLTGATLNSVALDSAAPSALSGVLINAQYGASIDGGESFANVEYLCSITVDVEPSDAESATFSIDNFSYTPQEGESLVVLLRMGQGLGPTYYQFPVSINADGSISFAISPLSSYFAAGQENTIAITAVTYAEEGEDYTYTGGGDASGTSGCDTGFAVLGLLLLAPFAYRYARKK